MKTIKRFTKLSAFLILTLSVIAFNFSPNNNNTRYHYNPKDTIKDSTDLTAQFQLINSEEYAKINSSFKTGHVTTANLKTTLTKNDKGFEIQLGRTNVPSPVIYKGKVFVSGGFGSKQYFAFDAKTGEKIWSVNLDDDGPSSAAIVDDIIVFNTESCTIFACNVETGEQIWSYWLGDPLMSMPTIANGIVFTSYPGGSMTLNQIIAPNQKKQQNNDFKNEIKNKKLTGKSNISTSHVLIAIQLRTGKILWQKRIDGDVMSAPVAVKNELYVTTFPGTVFKFKQKTGEILSAMSIRATSAPVIYKDQIFLSKRSDSRDEEVSEAIVGYSTQGMKQNKEYKRKNAPYLDKKVQGGSKLKTIAMDDDAGNGFSGGAPSSSGWGAANDNVGQSNVSSLQSFQGSRTLNYSGHTYNTMGDELICTNVKTGKEVWKMDIKGDMKSEGGFMGTPPISVGGNILIASYYGDIMVLNSKSGKQIREYKIKDNIRYQPVVQDGWIYLTTTSGKLVAINTKNKKLTGWPMWGANAARTNIVE